MGEYSENKFSIIIPAYNEEKIIGKTLENLLNMYKNAEIIVIDDNSSDSTFEVAQKTGVKVIHHKFNKGYGASLKTGIKAAKNEIVCFFDADGQHTPEDIIRLVNCLENNDIVIGARENFYTSNLLRAPGKFILVKIANFVAKTKIPDLNCGLRAVKKEVISKYLHLLPAGFSASTTMTLLMIERGYSIKYVPIKVNKRIGKSSVSYIKDGINTLRLMLNLIILFSPMRFFLPISLLFTVVGFLYGIERLIRVGSGFPVGGVLFIIFGVTTFFFGIIAEQISQLRKEKFEE